LIVVDLDSGTMEQPYNGRSFVVSVVHVNQKIMGESLFCSQGHKLTPMMTQTHILTGVALFGRPRETARNWMAIAGGVVPDFAIFVLYAIEKMKGPADSEIWGEIYFSDFWQDIVACGNSIPLWISLAAVGWFLLKRYPVAGKLILVFAGSCLAHMAMDLPVHVDDAHRHFFPLSDFRFRSPVSYWDPAHFGSQVALIEACFGIGLSVFLLRRYTSVAARIGIGFLLIGYLLVPAFFVWQMAT